MTNSTHPSPQALAALATAMLHASLATDLPTAATTLARAGVPVFPCVAGGKRPLTPRGFHDATSDPGKVTAWWQRRPEAIAEDAARRQRATRIGAGDLKAGEFDGGADSAPPQIGSGKAARQTAIAIT